MSTEQGTLKQATHRKNTDDVTSKPTSLGLNVVLVVLLFALFCAGLYVLSLFTTVTFLVGLAMVLLSLYLTFDTVPRLLS